VNEVDGVDGAAEIPGNVLPRLLRYGDDMAQLTHHPALHPQKGVPAPDEQALGQAAGRPQRDAQVVRDRMVHRGHEGKTLGLQAQHAVAEALVVVDEIVVPTVTMQVVAHASAEGIGLGKTTGELAAPFDHVRCRQQVPRLQGTEPVREQVEARQADQAHAVIELRVGWAGDDIDAMTRIDERLAQVMQIDALTTAVGLAAVTEQRDVQGFRRLRPRPFPRRGRPRLLRRPVQCFFCRRVQQVCHE
jgi:hypothetical protein